MSRALTYARLYGPSLLLGFLMAAPIMLILWAIGMAE